MKLQVDNYTKTTWINGSEPALNAENLNKIEAGIEAATNGVIALETNKMTDNDGDGDYPTSNAVKNYLESNYYDADDAENMFQTKLYAGENITISSVQSKAVISADLSETASKADTYTKTEVDTKLGTKYDMSNIEEGNATLTAYTGQGDNIKSASCNYQRIGGFVTVNVAVVFNAVTLNTNSSIHLINLPYRNALDTPVCFTGISSKNAVFKGSLPKSSTWLSMMYATSKAYTFTDGEQLNFTLIYKI